MSVELVKAARDILRRLPAGHPDRRFIAGVIDVAEGYNSRTRLGGKETPAEVKRFSPEAREALENEGYVIYELTGQSIRSLREEGGHFWSIWHRNYHEFETLTSRVSEVAINPREVFLPNSGEKTLGEQEKMIADFSKELARKVQGVEVVIGEAADYAELYFIHLDKTGEHLFGGEIDSWNIYFYARTETPTVGSNVADVGSAGPYYGVYVSHWKRDRGLINVFAAPLVVPA